MRIHIDLRIFKKTEFAVSVGRDKSKDSKTGVTKDLIGIPVENPAKVPGLQEAAKTISLLNQPP